MKEKIGFITIWLKDKTIDLTLSNPDFSWKADYQEVSEDVLKKFESENIDAKKTVYFNGISVSIHYWKRN